MLGNWEQQGTPNPQIDWFLLVLEIGWNWWFIISQGTFFIFFVICPMFRHTHLSYQVGYIMLYNIQVYVQLDPIPFNIWLNAMSQFFTLYPCSGFHALRSTLRTDCFWSQVTLGLAKKLVQNDWNACWHGAFAWKVDWWCPNVYKIMNNVCFNDHQSVMIQTYRRMNFVPGISSMWDLNRNMYLWKLNKLKSDRFITLQ